MFDFTNNLSACREKSDGPGRQVSDMKVLLVRAVHFLGNDGQLVEHTRLKVAQLVCFQVNLEWWFGI